ncbi:MAG: BON domain-containing protein [Pseudomonadales bacterium]
MQFVAKGLFAGCLVMLLGACTASDTRKTFGEGIDDSVLATKVKSALLADEVTDGLDVDVEVFRGRVQLNGFVDDVAQVPAASAIVRDINGVVSLSNNLTVIEEDRRTGEYIDDKVLKGKVSTAFTRSAEVSALDIEIEVNRGVVQLGGFVDYGENVREAEKVASAVAGVERVINNLEVKSL